ncbi:YbjN domain-containing protein [Paucidesulfovibrio longus]|uniref:YbjN domain-containing protein n=1 Tax=Paucidesulfovibrio longus TaxID=889 RepID=UPI0003B48460|nr:YbjN domain-containing protein [Paucidesulfovibrio longus]
MRRFKLCFAMLLAVALCGANFAADCRAQTLYDGISGAEMQRIMQNMGFKTELTKDDAGDPLISSSDGNLNFQIFFYACTKDVCEAVQFYSGFTQAKNPSQSSINTWNTHNRFGRAYLDSEGNSRVEMDALATGGVSEQHFRNLLSTWKIVLNEFSKHIGW